MLIELQDVSELHLRQAIPAHVEWSAEMNCFLAIDDLFQWHGQGGSAQMALQDLANIIVEDYNELRNWQGTLSRPLQERLNTMKKYIEDAS
jgi:hypothetical protein